MPYYKNKEDFIQPITISGKRFIVKPGQIIRVDRILDTSIYTFLEETTEINASEPLPFAQRSKPQDKKSVASAKSVEILSKKFEQNIIEISELKEYFKTNLHIIETLKSDIQSISEKVNISVTREQMLGLINSILKETPHIEPEELAIMADEVNTLKTELQTLANNNTVAQLSESVTMIQTDIENIKHNNEVFLKRLEILKKVVNNLETVVYDIVTSTEKNTDDEIIVVEDIEE